MQSHHAEAPATSHNLLHSITHSDKESSHLQLNPSNLNHTITPTSAEINFDKDNSSQPICQHQSNLNTPSLEENPILPICHNLKQADHHLVNENPVSQIRANQFNLNQSDNDSNGDNLTQQFCQNLIHAADGNSKQENLNLQTNHHQLCSNPTTHSIDISIDLHKENPTVTSHNQIKSSSITKDPFSSFNHNQINLSSVNTNLDENNANPSVNSHQINKNSTDIAVNVDNSSVQINQNQLNPSTRNVLHASNPIPQVNSQKSNLSPTDNDLHNVDFSLQADDNNQLDTSSIIKSDTDSQGSKLKRKPTSQATASVDIATTYLSPQTVIPTHKDLTAKNYSKKCKTTSTLGPDQAIERAVGKCGRQQFQAKDIDINDHDTVTSLLVSAAKSDQLPLSLPDKTNNTPDDNLKFSQNCSEYREKRKQKIFISLKSKKVKNSDIKLTEKPSLPIIATDAQESVTSTGSNNGEMPYAESLTKAKKLDVSLTEKVSLPTIATDAQESVLSIGSNDREKSCAESLTKLKDSEISLTEKPSLPTTANVEESVISIDSNEQEKSCAESLTEIPKSVKSLTEKASLPMTIVTDAEESVISFHSNDRQQSCTESLTKVKKSDTTSTEKASLPTAVVTDAEESVVSFDSSDQKKSCAEFSTESITDSSQEIATSINDEISDDSHSQASTKMCPPIKISFKHPSGPRVIKAKSSAVEKRRKCKLKIIDLLAVVYHISSFPSYGYRWIRDSM